MLKRHGGWSAARCLLVRSPSAESTAALVFVPLCTGLGESKVNNGFRYPICSPSATSRLLRSVKILAFVNLYPPIPGRVSSRIRVSGGRAVEEGDGVAAAAARLRDRRRRLHRLLARQAPPIPRLRRPRHSPRPK